MFRIKLRWSGMTVMEHEDDEERVPVPVRHFRDSQKNQEETQEESEEECGWQIPRRWYIY
jgi:hypothetical protein